MEKEFQQFKIKFSRNFKEFFILREFTNIFGYNFLSCQGFLLQILIELLGIIFSLYRYPKNKNINRSYSKMHMMIL